MSSNIRPFVFYENHPPLVPKICPVLVFSYYFSSPFSASSTQALRGSVFVSGALYLRAVVSLSWIFPVLFHSCGGPTDRLLVIS